MSMPATLVQSQTGTATAQFAPVRVGRTVALQVMQAGVWTATATGQQSSTGTATLTFANPTPGSYSYRAWTAAANGAPEFASSAAALEVTAAAPGPVTNVAAIPSSTSIALSWNNPADPSLSAVMIRRAVGETPPASATAGTLVTDAAKPAESFIDTAVTSGTQYSYALFAHDAALLFAMAGTVTTTTTVGEVPSITGTVTDAGPVRHGLANVRVSVYAPSTDTAKSVTTAADGTYAVSGLAAGTDYQVWFYPAGATGGSFDALGYLDQAYDNQRPMFGDTPTPVTVTEGATTTAINAALAVGGAITGTVTDAAGTRHGLAGVSVRVEIPSNGNYYGSAVTAADGSYAVQGMPAGTDYQVCFFANDATGGSTDALGYLDQCYDNWPTSGTPTPVTVALGASRAGVDAALAVGGAVSGTVSDAGGTHQGLANVTVGVYSPSRGGVNATTGADGTYTARGLPAGTDYQVCFYASGATGGSSNATGYLDQCFDNQPMSGTPTPVTVSLGATRVGADAALVAGGAISGTVSDAGGTQHGLENAWLEVSSPSTGTFLYATTAADGSYTVSGLPAATDYTVCFHGGGATGGSSDNLGYLDQCYDSQPMSGTPTLVTVTAGATATAVDAALGTGAP
jgi:Carboxypeptidase regulatory-like domain